MPICYQQRRTLHLEKIKVNAATGSSSSTMEETNTQPTKLKSENRSGVRSEEDALHYSPPPPRPASYVPPDERDISDPSLDYLSSDNPLYKIIQEKRISQRKSFSPSSSSTTFISDGMEKNESEIVLEDGQIMAPSPKLPTKPSIHYIDRHAERLHSTSVRGGHSLLDHHTGIDSGELYFARDDKFNDISDINSQISEEFTTRLITAKPQDTVDNSFHTHSLPKYDCNHNRNKNKGNNNASIDKSEKSAMSGKCDYDGPVLDNLKENKVHADGNVQTNRVLNPTITKASGPDVDTVTFFGLEEDKISWYKPVFDNKTHTYKSNARGTVYGRGDTYEDKPLELPWREEVITNAADNGNVTASHNISTSYDNYFEHRWDEQRNVSRHGKINGEEEHKTLTGMHENVDNEESTHVQRQREMLNRRMRWQNRLFSYSSEKAPVSLPLPKHVPTALSHGKVLEDRNTVELRGYAYPPSSELVNLKNSDRMQWLYALEATRHEKTLVDKIRQTYYKLRGKSDDKDEYVVTEGTNIAEDTSLWYKHFNIDALQRRQLRYMLADNDFGNINTAFHVMHTYPYADMIHAIMNILIILLLYKAQLYFNALELYDDYLGVDLTLTPGLKKPLLSIIALIIGGFYLSYPTCVLSVVITRAYRILLRRPIGPPEALRNFVNYLQ